MAAAHPDPFRAIDAQADPARLIATLEERGRTLAQPRLLPPFLRFIPVRSGDRVREVGCGSGVVLRDLAPRVGQRGRVVGVDPSRWLLKAAAGLIRDHPARGRVALRAADGEKLPFAV